MRWQGKLAVALLGSIAGFASGPVHAQGNGKYLAPADQVVAIRAGRLFDSRTGSMQANQVIVLKGDRIVDVGEGLEVPAGARLIDLSGATVMPGMIDAH